MIDFDTYIKMGEPGGKERAEAWKTGQKGVQPGSLKRCEAMFECLEIAAIYGELCKIVQRHRESRKDS